MEQTKFSVLMSVYAKEKVEYFKASIDSVLNQTLLPDEIILVRDGEVPGELQECIDGYLAAHGNLFTYITLEENVGLGRALNCGVTQARNNLIMRMDTDDIAVPDRFERQVTYFDQDPALDILGGQIEEFIDSPDASVSKREVPLDHDGITAFMKARNPMNHMTVAFKKDAVLKAGNYLDMHFAEDYYLWCRMFLAGCRFANLPETLVHVRIGKDMYRRRGGYKYFCSLKRLEDFKRKNKMIGWGAYMKNLILRFGVQVLCPDAVRGKIMKWFARK